MAEVEYGDAHRAVLQVLVREGAVPLERLFKLANRVLEVTENPTLDNTEKFDFFMQAINDKLNELNMSLQTKKRRAVWTDNLVYWVLVSTKKDDISVHGTDLKDKEAVAFKEILSFLVKSKRGNFDVEDVKATVDKSVDLHSLIKKLENNKWLVRDNNSKRKWTASVRTLAELEDDLLSLGARVCEINHFPVIVTKTYRAWYQDTLNKPFDDAAPAADEEQSENDDAPEVGGRSSQRPTEKRGKKRAVSQRKQSSRAGPVIYDDGSDEDEAPEEDEEEDEDEDEEDEEEQDDNPARQRRSQGKRRRA